jgi:hypothetical protein
MSEEQLDHNTALHHLIETGDAEEVSMILGHKDRLRCGGVIRTGVKVIKSSASADQKKLFAELEAQGFGYDDIDRKLGGAPKTSKSLLYPKNVDFFVIRDSDFTRAADAQYIREHFADPDGKVRRFPVWFSVGEIDRAIPHGFRAFDGSGLAAASFYEGKDLKVRYLPKGHVGPSKREHWKVAPFDPNKDERSPAGHKMDFGGFYRFNVPGLRGFDEIVIPTRSWYGMSYSVALLRRVISILGRFGGLLDGQPFFEMVKSPEEVRDPKGNRVIQFIPVLELSIDPMELARYAEPGAAAIRAQKAMATLTGSAFEVPAKTRQAAAAETPDSWGTPEETEAVDGPGESQEDQKARKVAMDYFQKAAGLIGVSWEQLATWAVLERTQGVALSDVSVAELRTLAAYLRGECAPAKIEALALTIRTEAEKFGVSGKK